MQMLGERLADELTAIVGESGFLPGATAGQRYRGDWSGDMFGAPLAVVRPRTTEQVSAIVAFCGRHGLRLVPQGGHTGLVGGGTPSDDGNEIVLSLELMNRIGPLDAHNFSIEVQAGCVLETVRAHVAEQGFVFPLALGSQGSCQIGGAIATNAGGLNVLRYGMMRELVLGVEVVLADGRVWNGMKGLRKDNTGYDLRQLILGSEGTLGIVTAAVLKLFPAPNRVETAFIGLPDLDAVLDLYARARRDLSDLLSAFELLTEEGVAFSGLASPLAAPSPVYVLMEVSTSGLLDPRPLVETFLESALDAGLIDDATIASGGGQASSFWKIREQIIEAQLRRGRHLRTDVSMPISAIPRFLHAAGAALRDGMEDPVILAYGHIGDGNLHYNVVPPEHLSTDGKIAYLHACEDIIFSAVDAVGGSISAEHGIGRLKRAAFLDRIGPAQTDLLRAVKHAFDPAGILNPGRMLEEAGR